MTDQTRPDQTCGVRIVNIQEAKTHLSRLVEEAASGEEIVIAKAGRPYVKLTPCLPEGAARKLGAWKGQGWVADDFDETPADVIALFEGRASSPRKRKP